MVTAHWFCNVLYLVGGIPTPLKNMKVSWDDYSRYMEKIKNDPNHQPVLVFKINQRKSLTSQCHILLSEGIQRLLHPQSTNHQSLHRRQGSQEG